MAFPLDVPESILRQRRSQKWSTYPADVLPLFVAETDVQIAPEIRDALTKAVTDGDTGYSNCGDSLPPIAAEYFRRFDPAASAAATAPVADVGVGVRESLIHGLPAGSDVVYTPPVYMPIAPWIRASGHQAVSVPLIDHAGPQPRLDVDAIEQAFAAGTRAIVLCHPHNPTGVVHSDAELAALADLAEKYDALVVSDEIWAPLTMPDVSFRSFLDIAGDNRGVGVAICSASKAFNLAGLKCAFCVVGDTARLELPRSLAGAVGHFGALAQEVALTQSLGWLDELRGALQHNVDLLDTLLAEHLPRARWRRPEATFVSWLDLRGYEGLGDDPAAAFLTDGRVALSSGLAFGTEGRGFVRLNFATSPEILTEAVTRMGAVATATG